MDYLHMDAANKMTIIDLVDNVRQLLLNGENIWDLFQEIANKNVVILYG